METDFEWQRPIRWAHDEPHYLCPLTLEDQERAAAWAAERRENRSTSVSKEFWPPRKVAATEHEVGLALIEAKRRLKDDLDAFLDSGDMPHFMSSQGGGSFTDPSDPLVSWYLNHDSRGIHAVRPTIEEMEWDRRWHGFWKPRRYQLHNPGYQAHAPEQREYDGSNDGRWEVKWGEIRALLRAERDAARYAELQPSLF